MVRVIVLLLLAPLGGFLTTPVKAQENVFVAGATGGTGIEVVKTLSDAGYFVRGGTRNPARARQRHGGLAQWVSFDALDPASVNAAVNGANIVVSTLGGRGLVGAGSPQFIEYLAVRNLVDAAFENDVRHFIILGAANTGPFEDHRKIARTGYLLYWKTKGEEYLKKSGVPYTIVGASGLRDEPRDGPGVRLLPRADYEWAGFVSRKRIAEVVFSAIENPASRNTAFAVIWDDAVPPGEIAGSFNDLRGPEIGPRRYEMPKYRW